MDKNALLDMALEKLMGDMDDIEGSSALEHDIDHCEDPLSCTMHDGELGENLSGGEGKPDLVKIEVKKMGLPTLEVGKKAEDGLDPEDLEKLRELLQA